MNNINEKDIAKEPKIQFYDGLKTICPFLCPTCNKPILHKRCLNCGQLIKWK